MAYQARMKRDKMVAELTAAKKESNFYLRKVEQAKAIDAMESRKRKRAAESGGAADAGGAAGAAGGAPAATADSLRQVRRHFRQRKIAKDASKQAANVAVLGNLLRSKAE